MPSDTRDCSPKPIFKGLTQLLLNAFGTEKLPPGMVLQVLCVARVYVATRILLRYVTRGRYGPKTKNEEFAKLFTTFYILIVLAILCVLAFVLMIILLVWYCKRKKYRSELCKNPKLWTRLPTSLLLLSLILLALFLFITFKSLLQLNELYNKSNDEASTEDDSIMKSINEVLYNDFIDLRTSVLLDCRQSDYLTDVYPETTKARKHSLANSQMFENFIETSIDSNFENILLYDDIFRMFSRNFSAFLGSSPLGKQYVSDTKSTRYYDAIVSLAEWGRLYQSSMAIKELMNIYKESAYTDDRMPRVCTEIKNYVILLASYARAQRIYLIGQLRSHALSKDPVVAPPYKFGRIVCIMAVVVLVVFFLLLICALCIKGFIMIKALLFIFVILTLLLILMAFVTFYHFFYGVIEYNGLCYIRDSSSRKENFNQMVLTECTNDQKLYTLMSENNFILPFSQWTDINVTKILDICKDTCRPMNMSSLEKLRPAIEDFPEKNQLCKFKEVKSTWFQNIRLVYETYDSKFAKTWISDIDPPQSYYHKRIKGTRCQLNLAIKAAKFRPEFNKEKYLKCRAGYKVGKDMVMSFKYTYPEIKTMCEIDINRCKDFVNKDITSIVSKVTQYKEKAERRLKNELGSCTVYLPMITRKRRTSCICETYILNGVWIGGLLFVLFLFLALLLLACLIYKLTICRDASQPSPDPIVLPPITLPRRVIDALEHDENPRVTYHVKKRN